MKKLIIGLLIISLYGCSEDKPPSSDPTKKEQGDFGHDGPYCAVLPDENSKFTLQSGIWISSDIFWCRHDYNLSIKQVDSLYNIRYKEAEEVYNSLISKDVVNIK